MAAPPASAGAEHPTHDLALELRHNTCGGRGRCIGLRMRAAEGVEADGTRDESSVELRYRN